jgi:hypothetical protein
MMSSTAANTAQVAGPTSQLALLLSTIASVEQRWQQVLLLPALLLMYLN